MKAIGKTKKTGRMYARSAAPPPASVQISVSTVRWAAIRSDVVMLAEPVEHEGDREDEKDREDVRAQRRAASGERPDQRQHRQVGRDQIGCRNAGRAG